MVRAAPSSPVFHAPDITIDRPVIDATTNVSTNTSVAPQMPCSTGCFTIALEWIIVELPKPASLENKPLAIPFVTIIINVVPAKPPVAPAGVNAPLKISPIALGTSLIFKTITARPAITYIPHIKGVSHWHTSPILVMPPRITIAVRIENAIPVAIVGIPNCVCTDMHMEFVSTIAPTTKYAIITITAKKPASIFECSPFSM